MKGFIQIPLLVILVVGTGVGVYVVQQKTHFLPKAFSGEEILKQLSNKPPDIDSSPQPFTYLPPTPKPKPTNDGLLSAFQRLLLRNANTPPVSSTPRPQIDASPIPEETYPATYPPLPTDSPAPSESSTEDNSDETSDTTTGPKPICGVLVLPSSGGQAPYEANICVGNNSNPYQAVQEELADYDGNGNWDYQGPSYGCHSYTFQNPGTYYPKAKIISTSGQESDVCQTTAIISGASSNPTPTPSPTPTPNSSADTCSQGSLGMYIKFQDITANGPTLKYVNLSLKQPGTNNELWKFNSLGATNNISEFFNYSQGDLYRIALSGVNCGTYDIYVSSTGYQEKKFPNIVVDNNPWNDPEVYIFNGPLIPL